MGLLNRVRPLTSYANATSDIVQPSEGGKVKVALCQLSVTDDKQSNILNARSLIHEAAENGAELIVLPEMWNCPYSNDSFPTYAEDLDSGFAPTFTFMSETAKNLGIVLVGGSIPEKSQEKLYNSCFIFGKTGQMLGRFSKLHLFDIDIPGKITFKESETLTSGTGPLVVDTEVGRIAVGICYDIRFPELAGLYASRGAQILIYPGAFNMTTGPLHWELLQRARAVDNQLCVLTCSPARNQDGPYIAWGHSTAVGPFGEVVATTDHSQDIVYAELDLDQIPARRANMPLQQQKRSDLYALMDLTRDEPVAERK
eukprot:CAMPEP_0118798280 /NCGR_PEP_ID=MMETSP1161-20130426/696_1 /TAXON_ID=249345 /ORGANISM="Picochlorum oklahomensis, Strain CCMP2329" /LENGTH=312 /DNA_ID=CAMNT_0006725657 /DNA_START=142 /DNA_END=1080 /DNA_ORIENTATION=-